MTQDAVYGRMDQLGPYRLMILQQEAGHAGEQQQQEQRDDRVVGDRRGQVVVEEFQGECGRVS
jgi:hypothetical protein